MPGKDLVPRSAHLPAAVREVFIEWYFSPGVTFHIVARNPECYPDAKLKAIGRINGIASVKLNKKRDEISIIVQLLKTYQRKAAKIEQVASGVANLLDVRFRYIAYIPGDGMQELPSSEWASMR